MLTANPAGRVAPAPGERNLWVAKIGLLIALARCRAVRHRRVVDRAGHTDRRSGEHFIFCVLLPRQRDRLVRAGRGSSAHRSPGSSEGDYSARCSHWRPSTCSRYWSWRASVWLDTDTSPYLLYIYRWSSSRSTRDRPDREGAWTGSELRRHVVMVVRRMGCRSSRGRRCCSPCKPGAVSLGEDYATTAPHSSSARRGVVAKAVTTLYFSRARVERRSPIAAIEPCGWSAARIRLVSDGRVGLAGIGIAYCDAVRRRGGARSRHRAHHPGSVAESQPAV